MITLIHQKPVRSNVENGEVRLNKQDIYNALDLHRFDIPQPIYQTSTISADVFYSTVMEFLGVEQTEAIDVWLRDAIDGNNARHLYPPDMYIGKIIDYWERVSVELTGKTPNQLLDKAKMYRINVQSWQDALRYLDYPTFHRIKW